MADARVLGGRYQIGEELGYGGMAEVFRARDTRLGRDVAVKILRADLARDPSFLQRFQREAQSAAGLNHANIVGVYDQGEDGGRPYIVMEYVAGRTLRDVLAEDGRLLPRRALEIVSEICAALDYSHRQGIVHRDIKPANVMLTRTGEVKVMDFGIARAASASSATMTQTAQILGTAQYLSPEQARGEHVDGRSDVYSTGCLLYELLTGVPPFQGESAVAVAYQHVREDPLPPSQIDAELPSSLDAVVLKAMAKNPANRYQTAADFRADVDRAAAGRRVEATPVLAAAPTAPTPVSSTTVLLRPNEADRDSRRRTAYIALAVAVLAVFIAVAFIVKHFFDGSGDSSVNIPNVVGITEQQAEAQLSGLGLNYSVTQTPQGQNGNNQPAGKVYKTSPDEGFPVKRGFTVQLFVSSGIQRVQVPDLTGKTLDDAKALLKNAGLSVGTVTQQNVNGAANTVLSQGTPAGSTVNAGTTVDVTVVSGSQQVPSTIGSAYAQAVTTLEQAGFQAKQGDTVTSTQYPAGTVVDYSPKGTQANGTVITLTISGGPPSTSSSAPPTSSTSPSGSPSTTPSATTTP